MSLILSLDKSGTPHSWVTWQDAVTYKAKNLIAWSAGEVSFDFRGGNSRMTGERTIVTVPSIIALNNHKTPKYKTPALNNKNLFRRDLNICAYCGHKFVDAKLTRDHIVPVSRGGMNTWKNCVTACKKCNNFKDNSLLEDLNMQLLYVPYVPDRSEALILSNRTILADQMEFLLPYLPEHSRAPLLLQ